MDDSEEALKRAAALHPAVRDAMEAAAWLGDASLQERATNWEKARRVARIAEEAWGVPQSRKIALMLLCAGFGWSHLEIAEILGISMADYKLIETGQRGVSREELEKIALAKGVSLERLEEILLRAHGVAMLFETQWEVCWERELAALSPQERREKVLQDRNLQNWGLGEHVCAMSLEAREPDEGVALAELALLIAEKHEHRARVMRRRQSYARGHLGHALERRGDHAAAETAYAECIKLWTTGEGIVESEERKNAERLASIVPSFPPYVPSPPRRKPAKRKGSPKAKPRARRMGKKPE